MPWGKLDDQLHNNAKVLSLSDKEFRVWIYSISFCNAKRGKRPGDYENMTIFEALGVCRLAKAPPAVVGRLVSKRGWEASPTGYVVHDLRGYAPKVDLTAAERQGRRRDKQRDEPVINAPVTRDEPVTPHADARGPVPLPIPLPVPSTLEHQPEETDSQEETHLVARARVFAVPKPGEKLGSPHAALSRALADAIGHEEPRGDRRWKEAIGVLVKCGVTADGAAGLVSTYLEHYTTPISARAIAENLTALRHPRVGRGKPKAEPRSYAGAREAFADLEPPPREALEANR